MDIRKFYTDILTESVLKKIDEGDTRSKEDIIAEACIASNIEQLTESEKDLVIQEILKNVNEYLGEEVKQEGEVPKVEDTYEEKSFEEKEVKSKEGEVEKELETDDKQENVKPEIEEKMYKESQDVLKFSQYVFGNVKSALGSNVEDAKTHTETYKESLHFIKEETNEQFIVRTFNGKTTVNRIEEMGNDKMNVKFYINEADTYQMLAQNKYMHRNVTNPEVKSLIEFTQRSGRNVYWSYQGNCYKMVIR